MFEHSIQLLHPDILKYLCLTKESFSSSTGYQLEFELILSNLSRQ
jgi:hypothetical protein